ncbi:hypothetical protein KDE12_05105 [Campylobacter sp. faydin G-105]|uniref:hypothetical protein n=1 Tax=Campylobacter anatolicus TaxID=2829105 RepID=UPI001B8F8AFD|nr:hypothetical protein [Campylobacter anatolicus]MBR8462235.1 hypothetical protein [Campylobacter anatolicus]
MSVSPLGNSTFINQNAPVASAVQSNHQARFDLQSAMTEQIAQEKDKQITQLRPTEETYKIDPQHEHEKKKQEQQESLAQNLENNTNEDSDENEPNLDSIIQTHHLDIKI